MDSFFGKLLFGVLCAVFGIIVFNIAKRGRDYDDDDSGDWTYYHFPDNTSSFVPTQQTWLELEKYKWDHMPNATNNLKIHEFAVRCFGSENDEQEQTTVAMAFWNDLVANDIVQRSIEETPNGNATKYTIRVVHPTKTNGEDNEPQQEAHQ